MGGNVKIHVLRKDALKVTQPGGLQLKLTSLSVSVVRSHFKFHSWGLGVKIEVKNGFVMITDVLSGLVVYIDGFEEVGFRIKLQFSLLSRFIQSETKNFSAG